MHPQLQWVRCERPEKDEYSREVSHTADVHSLLGLGRTVSSSVVDHNPRRGRNLDYQLVVKYRDEFLRDGSKLNASIMHCIGYSETSAYQWRGPVLILRQIYGTYKNITLDDFRDALDYFTTYNYSRVTEYDTIHQQIPRKIHGEVMGVQINSDGEMELHGSPRFAPVGIPREHLIRVLPSERSMRASISQKVGIPLLLRRVIEGESPGTMPGVLNFDSLGCNFSNNQAVTFLMTETDPLRPNWGFSSLSQFSDVGNVIVMREDGRDVTVEKVEAICEFSQHFAGPIFEEAMESTRPGDTDRRHAATCNFLTPENFDIFLKGRRTRGISRR